MSAFFTAIGLILVIEGVLYALFPAAMKRAMQVMLGQPVDSLRIAGLGAATFGVGIIWVIRHFGT